LISMKKNESSGELEKYFGKFRDNVVGIDAYFKSPYGRKKILYADWIASGRLYRPIEETMIDRFGPYVGNTHSYASETGSMMTSAYHFAHDIIKKHVNANENDVIITANSGMTGVVCKFQRILGLKMPEKLEKYCIVPEEERPVIFITHLEHHSNHTSWLETIADVVVLEPDENLMVSTDCLEKEIEQYGNRKIKIGAFSGCSNVTGYIPPYNELAKIMHRHDGYCFIDFAASAPYVEINMHPDDGGDLDAIYFSPHKFLGGPGSSGVLIFNKKLYKNRIPDHPGGGTLNWTNRWNEHSYISDVETREDGGTPGFIQAIRAALSIRLKEEMGVEKILKREREMLGILYNELATVAGLRILAENITERLGVVSFYIEGIHHNLVTKLLNDRFGIQVRGGCSCAGTYGHYLLNVDWDTSHDIAHHIDHGDLSLKPGWIRLSLHPVMTDEELFYIINSIREITSNYESWAKDYRYDPSDNEFYHLQYEAVNIDKLNSWFTVT
jgi:selenocysteine lyase/cysteine desulfurase